MLKWKRPDGSVTGTSDPRHFITPSNMTLSDVLSDEQQTQREELRRAYDHYLRIQSLTGFQYIQSLCYDSVMDPEFRARQMELNHLNLDKEEYQPFLRWIAKEQKSSTSPVLFGRWYFSWMAKMTEFHYKPSDHDPMPDILVEEDIVDSGALLAKDCNEASYRRLQERVTFVGAPQLTSIGDISAFWYERGMRYGLIHGIQWQTYSGTYRPFSNEDRTQREKASLGMLVAVSTDLPVINNMYHELASLKANKFVAHFRNYL